MTDIVLSKLTKTRIKNDYLNYIESDKDDELQFDIYPNPNNILEIYFVLFGLKDSPYDNGFYIGKIVHSPNYPIKAPDYYMFTPNGRFEINKKICLTTSGFHQDDWVSAAWNLLSLLKGFSSIWHSTVNEDKIGISHISKTTVTELKKLAKESLEFNKKNMLDIFSKFPKMKKYL
jgi:ubiquitin-conjugating enzyme E2 J2